MAMSDYEEDRISGSSRLEAMLYPITVIKLSISESITSINVSSTSSAIDSILLRHSETGRPRYIHYIMRIAGEVRVRKEAMESEIEMKETEVEVQSEMIAREQIHPIRVGRWEVRINEYDTERYRMRRSIREMNYDHP